MHAPAADVLARVWLRSKEGMALMSTGGENFCLSELLRIKGKLLLARSVHDRDAAESAFSEALSVSGAQHAKTLELRAA
jgi:hypothetical protein